jgi:hypothetical protein
MSFKETLSIAAISFIVAFVFTVAFSNLAYGKLPEELKRQAIKECIADNLSYVRFCVCGAEVIDAVWDKFEFTPENPPNVAQNQQIVKMIMHYCRHTAPQQPLQAL